MNIAREQDLLATVITTLPEVRRVAVFAPHPDDEVFGCGGTIYRLARKGATVEMHIVTDGALGGMTVGNDLVARREMESFAAAAVLGVATPVFWQLPDRSLTFCEPLINRVQQVLNDSSIELLFAPAPSEIHPDHQALGLACAEAVRRMPRPLKVAFYEIGAPLARANLLIDISAAEEIKSEAMGCFATQLVEQPYHARVRGLNQFRGLLLGPTVTAAEAFLLVGTEAFANGLQPLFDGPVAYRQRLGYVADLTDQPLISVVVRSMERPSLDEALTSLALQLYPNIEVIVVNARGEGHRNLADTCGSFPLRLINEDGPPLGRSAAANAGLQACRGTFISFLDDDDVILPDHLSGLEQAIRVHQHPVAVYSAAKGVRRGDANDAVLCHFREATITFTKLLLGNVLPIHSVLFPARVLETSTVFDETLDCYEDWDFWLQLLLQLPFVFVDQQTAIYYLGGDSGISPLDPDQRQVSQSLAMLYGKWRKMILPETLTEMHQLYQEQGMLLVRREGELNAQLHQRNLELADKDAQLHQRNLKLADTDAQLHQRNLKLADTDAQLHQRNLELADKDVQLHQLELQLLEKEGEVAKLMDGLVELEQQLTTIKNTRLWKIGQAISFAKRQRTAS